MTDVLNNKDGPPQFNPSGYFRQKGPYPFGATYNIAEGGSTLHWLGTCLRRLPTDFRPKDLCGAGRNWPINYHDLMPYYRMAEYEIGVSADVDDQKFLGIEFEEDYVYPMHKIPQSDLDHKLTEWTDDVTFEYEGDKYSYSVVSTPQGRNSTPNAKYDNGNGYRPVGAVGNADLGQRCEGNSSCIPICLVSAKYSALKTLKRAIDKGAVLWSQCVASEILYKRESNYVTGITFRQYKSSDEIGSETTCSYVEKTVTAARYVLAGNTIENAKLMLASGFKNKNIGRNLMDHPLLTWGSARENIGAFRGPGSTSGIPALRDGSFRGARAAFRVEIGDGGGLRALPQVTLIVRYHSKFLVKS